MAERTLTNEESLRVLAALRRPADWPKDWNTKRKIPLSPAAYRERFKIAPGACLWCRCRILVPARTQYCSDACASEWSVRASNMPYCASLANDDHTFWPLTTSKAVLL